MTALVDLPAFRERLHGISLEGYHRLGEMGLLSKDVELLRGLVVTKMPKSPLHEFVAQKLGRQLIQKVPVGYEIRREGPLTLSDSEPEPDISVVRGKPEDWMTAHPSTAELVIEVAVTIAALDEGKAEIYAEAGIPEYWVVRPEDRVIDVYREPAGQAYRSKITLTEQTVINSLVLADVQFQVSEILPPR